MSDWIGNSMSIFAPHGASSHSEEDRADFDYYATHPSATEELLKIEDFKHEVWECACGEKHMSNVLQAHGYDVRSSDILNRGGYSNVEILDFLATTENVGNRDIITNPPYKFAKEFVEHALDISADGTKVAMFLKLTFLEGQARRSLYEKYPPKRIHVFARRAICAKNGDFKNTKSSAVCYAWFIWEKGYKGDIIIDRIE